VFDDTEVRRFELARALPLGQDLVDAFGVVEPRTIEVVLQPSCGDVRECVRLLREFEQGVRRRSTSRRELQLRTVQSERGENPAPAQVVFLEILFDQNLKSRMLEDLAEGRAKEGELELGSAHGPEPGEVALEVHGEWP